MENNTIKVGDKSKHMSIPDGYALLKPDEIVKDQDKVANIRKFKWELVDTDDVGYIAEVVGDYVIRETIK